MPKPTLLLLHGALGSPATLHPLADLLAADFTVKTLAFAGHGGREVNSATFTLPAFGAEVLAFLQAEPYPVHVFGYSMGGYAALLAARQKPARLASLTTLGTKLDWSPESAAAETRQLDPVAMQAKVPAFVEQLRELHAPTDWATVVTATAQLMRAADAAPPLASADYPAILVPVQLLVGDADRTVDASVAAAVAAQLPHGEFALLPDTPHPLARVNLELLAGRVRRFAGQHSLLQ